MARFDDYDIFGDAEDEFASPDQRHEMREQGINPDAYKEKQTYSFDYHRKPSDYAQDGGQKTMNKEKSVEDKWKDERYGKGWEKYPDSYDQATSDMPEAMISDLALAEQEERDSRIDDDDFVSSSVRKTMAKSDSLSVGDNQKNYQFVP